MGAFQLNRYFRVAGSAPSPRNGYAMMFRLCFVTWLYSLMIP